MKDKIWKLEIIFIFSFKNTSYPYSILYKHCTLKSNFISFLNKLVEILRKNIVITFSTSPRVSDTIRCSKADSKPTELLYRPTSQQVSWRETSGTSDNQGGGITR